jgi:hypothetical protein
MNTQLTFCQRHQEHITGERQPLQQMVLGKLDTHMSKLHMNDHHVHKNVLNITHLQGNASQNHNDLSLHTF